MLPDLKRAEETAWLSEVNAQSLQAASNILDIAYQQFFKTKVGFPKFKSKHNRQSFQCPQRGKVDANSVSVPIIGRIPAVIDRPPVGKIKTVIISRTTTGKYFASVHCDTGVEAPTKRPVKESTTVGIDLGLKEFAVLSTGERVANPRHLKKALRRLRRAARIVSRRQKGGKNRAKARRRLALQHETVAARRNDFLHRLTTRLVRDNQTDSFAIEDLAVSNMVRNPRLARSISDAGWGEFRRQLEYKAEQHGKNVLVIGQFEPSSKACPCGLINRELKLSDRVWTCACGKTHDRDLNAARNIRRFALHPLNKSLPPVGRESTPVEISSRRSSKQESRCASI